MSGRNWTIVSATFTMWGVAAVIVAVAEEGPRYKQQENVVYDEVHGVGLLMDVFQPTSEPNGRAIVDVASGAWYSDRGKIRDHQRRSCTIRFVVEVTWSWPLGRAPKRDSPPAIWCSMSRRRSAMRKSMRRNWVSTRSGWDSPEPRPADISPRWLR